jgi:hypothetical protein
MMPELIWPSTIVLILFSLVAAIDGTYYHLKQNRLYQWQESLLEHLLHTVRAFLIIPTLWLLYIEPARGLWLYIALALVVIDLIVMVADTLIEYQSRAHLGGLSRGEYTVHLISNSLHMIAIALAFASFPPAAWRLDQTDLPAIAHPQLVKWVARTLLFFTVIGTLQHLFLIKSEALAGLLKSGNKTQIAR